VPATMSAAVYRGAPSFRWTTYATRRSARRDLVRVEAAAYAIPISRKLNTLLGPHLRA